MDGKDWDAAEFALGPGDVVMTGAPGTAVAVHPGDRVDIVLGGIGTLTNTVELRDE